MRIRGRHLMWRTHASPSLWSASSFILSGKNGRLAARRQGQARPRTSPSGGGQGGLTSDAPVALRTSKQLQLTCEAVADGTERSRDRRPFTYGRSHCLL